MKVEATALAALSLTESLILALAECGKMPCRELRGVVEDAATSHRQAAAQGDNPEVHDEAAKALESIRNALECIGRRDH